MKSVYETCPVWEDDTWLLRFVEEGDADDLLAVYSDKNALPFFNSDNCNGDNFYYPTRERMLEAIRFWLASYERKQFVRLAIVEKSTGKAIGTVELFHRASDDAFNGSGVLRLDVGSRYERKDVLLAILSLVIAPSYALFDCSEIITKVPLYAVERREAVSAYGFEASGQLMVGTHDRYAYNGYWVIRKN